MMRGAAPALVLAAASLVSAASRVWADTAYVSDQLVLNVYSEQNLKGQRLATLHSGARVETLATIGDFTQVRLADGATGWVTSSYLMPDEPTAVRLKHELERRERDLAALATQAPAAGAEPLVRPHTLGAGLWLGAALAAGALGFWGGYATLARRVRRKFGGVKVY